MDLSRLPRIRNEAISPSLRAAVRRLSRPIAIAAFTIAVSFSATSALAGVLQGTATMGDSLSIKAQPFKWPVLLQTYRGFNFGGANMPYVHAVGGSTSSEVLSLRQPQKVANPVQAGKVTSATFLVGGNDYADAGGSFINGSLSGAALTTFENKIVANIEKATGIVLDSGIYGFILGSVPFTLGEPQAVPLITQYPAAAIASDASVQRVNAQLLSYAESLHIPYIDFYEYGKLFVGIDQLIVGGVPINAMGVGSDPHNFFVDNVHPGYIGNGMIANLWMEAFNIAYGTNLTLFTDQDMLAMAGISGYTGETFSPTIDYASLIHFTPLPGDANSDRVVDGLDYTAWANNFSQPGKLSQGDFNNDGVVDGLDYTIWADHFSVSSAAIPQFAVVPEPAAFALAALGGLLLAAGRFRRRELRRVCCCGRGE